MPHGREGQGGRRCDVELSPLRCQRLQAPYTHQSQAPVAQRVRIHRRVHRLDWPCGSCADRAGTPAPESAPNDRGSVPGGHRWGRIPACVSHLRVGCLLQRQARRTSTCLQLRAGSTDSIDLAHVANDQSLGNSKAALVADWNWPGAGGDQVSRTTRVATGTARSARAARPSAG